MATIRTSTKKNDLIGLIAGIFVAIMCFVAPAVFLAAIIWLNEVFN